MKHLLVIFAVAMQTANVFPQDCCPQPETAFLIYKPVCCANPYFEAGSDEGFDLNGKKVQPISRLLLQDIPRLPLPSFTQFP